MDKDKINKWLGILKTWQVRFATYLSVYTFGMVLYLFVIEEPGGFKWYHLAVVLGACSFMLMFLDVKIIMPSSLAYQAMKNPMFMKLFNTVMEMKKQMDEKEKE